MGFDFSKFIKGIRIFEENTLTPKKIDIIPGGTANTTTTIQASQTTDKTLTLPDATDTLVGKATTDTLTNKSIDAEGTGNSITNLKDANIKAGAAIAHNKMAALTANKALASDASGVVVPTAVTDTELGYVSGVTSAIQTQLTSNAGAISSHTGASSGVHGVTGSVVGTSDSQTLTNKTVDAASNTISNISNTEIKTGAAIDAAKISTGIVSNTEFNTLSGVTSAIQTQLNGKEATITATTAADYYRGDKTFQPLNPTAVGLSNVTNDAQLKRAAGDLNTFTEKIAPVADDILILEDSANSFAKAKVKVGNISSGAGGKNYIKTASANGTSLTGWSNYANTAGLKPVTGTGGSPTLALATSTSSPLSGASSFLYSKSAANKQGEGFSYDMTIDPSDMGKVLALSLNYSVSANYADDDMIVYLYDVTNSALLEPVPFKIKKHTLASERFFCEVQVPYNCSSLRLIFHISSTSTLAYDLKIDDLLFGPQAKLYGSVATDLIPFTLTSSWSDSATTAAYRRVGDSAEFFISLKGGSLSAISTFSVTLPNGMQIDSSKLEITSTLAAIGEAIGYNAATAGYNGVVAAINSTTVQIMGRDGVANFWNATTPFVWATNSTLTLHFTVPILGWGVSQLLSTDAETRVVVASATGGTAPGTHGTIQQITGMTVEDNPNGLYSTDSFTINSSGWYVASAKGYFNANGAAAVSANIVYVYKNGVEVYHFEQDSIAVQNQTTNIFVGGKTKPLNFKAGDVITFHASQTSTTTRIYSGESFSVEKLQGPAQIAASEKILVSVKNPSVSLTTLPTATIFGAAQIDTHGAWNGSRFTAPVAGKYKISLSHQVTITGSTVNQYINYGINKNGASYTYKTFRCQNSSLDSMSFDIDAIYIDVIAGDYIEVGNVSSNFNNIVASADVSFISIEKV